MSSTSTSYYGLPASIYNGLIDTYGDAFNISGLFDSSPTDTPFGQIYLFNGRWDEYFDFLSEAGLEEQGYDLQLYQYMNSTWTVVTN